jgi:hypothetical protein
MAARMSSHEWSDEYGGRCTVTTSQGRRLRASGDAAAARSAASQRPCAAATTTARARAGSTVPGVIVGYKFFI